MPHASMKKRRGKSPAPKTRPAPKHPGGALLWLAGILAVTFLVYLPSLGNDFTNWDDEFYVTENPLLAHPGSGALLTTPLAGNYHPLTMLSLALNYHLSGLNPGSYHWLNLLLHLANTALVFALVLLLSGGRLWTSVATSLLFGVHPMHVESVAWIAERKDVLYTLFYLLGLIAYVRFIDRKRALGLGSSWAAMLLSAAAKPAAVVFPLTLLLIDWFRRRKLTAGVLLEKLPFFAISIAGGVLTLRAQHLAGAVALQWSPVRKVLFACYGTAMYMVKLLLPFRLSAIYPYPNVEGRPLGPEYYVAAAAVLVLLPLLLYACRRLRPVLFGVAFFFINIILVLQIVTVGQAVMADRYTYVPYIGLLFALTWWLDEKPGAITSRFPVRAVLAGVLATLLLVCLVQTWNRCGVWKNSITLWNDTISKYPGRIVDAYNNRGNYLYRVAGRPQEALADFDQALALNSSIPKVWLNKGTLLAQLGQGDSAYACLERAIALKPDYAEAIGNRGALRLQRGDATGAVSDLSRALAIDPRLRDAYANRALAYFSLRQYEGQIDDLRRAIALNPSDPENHKYVEAIGEGLDALGRHEDAVGQYDQAIRMAPARDPRLGLYFLRRSLSWWALGSTARALADAREAAARGAPVDPDYLRKLGG